jgi:hypothetical protein
MFLPKKTGKVILAISSMVILSGPVSSLSPHKESHPDISPSINIFFEKIYNFSFHEADSMVLILQKSGIDGLTLANVQANLAWWRILSGDNIQNNLKSCNDLLKKSTKVTLGKEKLNADSLLNTIYAFSLKSRLESHRGNRLTSLMYFYKSIEYIEECITRPVTDEGASLLKGLYFYLSDYVLKEYHLVGSMLLPVPSGTREQGLRYLERCSMSADRMIRTEANYFLLKIYSDTEAEYQKAWDYANILTLDHPNNLVYSLEKYKLMILMNNQDEARLYHDRLIEKIRRAEFLNSNQKTHFLDIIEQVSKTGT